MTGVHLLLLLLSWLVVSVNIISLKVSVCKTKIPNQQIHCLILSHMCLALINERPQQPFVTSHYFLIAFHSPPNKPPHLCHLLADTGLSKRPASTVSMHKIFPYESVTTLFTQRDNFTLLKEGLCMYIDVCTYVGVTGSAIC